MSNDNVETDTHHIEMAVEIVLAYVSNNAVPASDLPSLISRVHASINGLAIGDAGTTNEPTEKPSAAEIRKSATPDGITSFIDGRVYQTLKRHLTSHGLTPDTYRARYGLPDDYPMVASAYSERRSSLAKAIGLGVPGSQTEKAPQPDEFDQAAPEQAAPKGRRRKAA